MKYVIPDIKITSIEPMKNILLSSNKDKSCGRFCKYWHICRDRQEGMFCADKKY